jgi:hypothetical protein
MAILPGFQRTATKRVNEILPGDVYSGRTAAVLGANGKFALGTVTIGNGCFLATNANQVASSTSAAGTSVFAGIVLRNQGGAPLSWADSQTGYGYSVTEGAQVSVGFSGQFGALITGVNGSGVANHVPVVGEQIWVNITTGAFACVPAGVTTVTGYVIAPGWLVNRIAMYNATVTVGANQSLCLIAGQLAGM